MTGIKSFIKYFKKPFDAKKKAKSKADQTGKTSDEVLKEWEELKINGEELHKFIQSRDSQLPNVKNFHTEFSGEEKVVDSLVEDEPLENNTIYLERPTFSKKHGLWGFPDRIDVVKNCINIIDHKSFKKLNRKAPTIKIGTGFIKMKYEEPLDHLDECNYNDSVLQLSLYMYLLWDNNRKMRVGKLFINHLKTNARGELVGEELVEVPYLRKEVLDMLNHKKLNNL